jgi:hypothetical protein
MGLSFEDIPLCERRWSCNKPDFHSTAATALYIAVVVDPEWFISDPNFQTIPEPDPTQNLD